MENMWFVLVTTVSLTEGNVDGKRVVPGDVLDSSLVAAADNLEDCEIAAAGFANLMNEIYEGTSITAASCLYMPADVGEYQNFEDIEDIEDIDFNEPRGTDI